MICNGEFIFKSVEKRDAGEFTNEKGDLVKYDSSYILKVDEINKNGIFERKLKVSKDNTALITKLFKLEPYTKINVTFDVNFYGANIRIVPTDTNLIN